MKTTPAIFCFLFVIGTGIKTTAKAQAVNVQDSLALVDLYNSTNGPSWINHSNWLTGPAKTWYGITLSANRVTEIYFSNNKLNGIIPSSLGNLTKLTSLTLYSNQLSGSIPASLGNLINLNSLNLSMNQLSESIPSSLENLVNLSSLYLYSNQLSGNIPVSLGNLINLSSLFLNDNELSGNIPPSFGKLVNLESLLLYNNQLSGSIPSSLGNLVNLDFLSLYNNQLSGGIPSSLGNLINLTALWLNDNQLSGNIPASLGNLVNLTLLYLSDNQLSGSIPASLSNLTFLRYLRLNSNQLNSSIPSYIGDLLYLDELLLNNNQLSGGIPSSLGNLSRLHYLYLDNNKLSGSIPSSLGNLPRLFYLNLDSNRLSGDVSMIANIPLLRKVSLSGNLFIFNGMELIAQKFHNAKYNDQAYIPIHQNGNALSVSAGGTLSNNTYGWYMVGQTDTTFITGDSIFYPVQSGRYRVKIRNAVATKLTLKSLPIDYVAPPVLNNTFIASSESALQQHDKATVFLVYPNPAKDMLHIQTQGKVTIQLSDQSGKILITKTINGNGEINVSQLAAGLYYLKNKNTGETQKIIVTK